MLPKAPRAKHIPGASPITQYESASRRLSRSARIQPVIIARGEQRSCGAGRCAGSIRRADWRLPNPEITTVPGQRNVYTIRYARLHSPLEATDSTCA